MFDDIDFAMKKKWIDLYRYTCKVFSFYVLPFLSQYDLNSFLNYISLTKYLLRSILLIARKLIKNWRVLIKRFYGLYADKTMKILTMCKLLYKKCMSRYASVQTSNVLFEFAWFDLNTIYCISINTKSSNSRVFFQIMRTSDLNLCTDTFFLTPILNNFHRRIVSGTKDSYVTCILNTFPIDIQENAYCESCSLLVHSLDISIGPKRISRPISKTGHF